MIGTNYIIENVKLKIWNVTPKCKGIVTIETTSSTRIHSDVEIEDDLSIDSFEEDNDFYLTHEEWKETIQYLRDKEAKQI